MNDKTFIKFQNLDKRYEVYFSQSYFIWIGNGGNIAIQYEDCNTNKSSYASLGYSNSYETPQGMQPGSKEANSYLAGDETYTVEEIEVYKLII